MNGITVRMDLKKIIKQKRTGVIQVNSFSAQSEEVCSIIY